jgi:hypothetical protein
LNKSPDEGMHRKEKKRERIRGEGKREREKIAEIIVHIRLT